jgi:hypothetical protein
MDAAILETNCPRCFRLMRLEVDPDCDDEYARRIAAMIVCEVCTAARVQARPRSAAVAVPAPTFKSWAALSCPVEN